MVIQHNINGLNAYNKMNFNVTATKKASEKLASGFRINRSADDASGLAVSEKMRSQIRGLKQAARNCQDGVNLVQTFEGALSQSHEILKRCTELAEEVANGTYDDPTDRAAAQLEYNELCKEIDAISDTDFNGLTMLNGGKLAALREKYKGLNWLNPGNVDWEDGTLINQTDPYDPNFKMVISKMPGLDSLKMATDDELQALQDFDKTPISVDLEDGKTKFYFDCSPVPDNLSIETRGTTGIVSIKTVGSVIEIAKVTVPDVSRILQTTSKGYWGSSTDYSRLSMPTEQDVNFSDSQFMLGNNASAIKGSYYDSTDQMRKDYNEWLKNIPTVQFTVNKDDLEKFTIPSRFKNQVLDYDENKVYTRGDTITVISKVDNGTKTVYTPVKVDWNPSTVKPGAAQNVTQGYYSRSYGSRDFSQGSGEDYVHHYDAYTFGDVTTSTKERRFLNYGRETFNIQYQETKAGSNGTSSGVWTITVSNFDSREPYPGTPNGISGTTLTINSKDNLSAVDYFLNELGLARSTLTNGLGAIHANGNKIPSVEKNPDGTPKHNFTINNNQTYSMSVTTAPSSPDVSSISSWYSGTSKYTYLSLGKYNPNNPGSSGIDYDVALAGNYTYHNDNMDDGVHGDSGYWTNPKGETVELEDEGIYLSKTSSTFFPLHDGFTIVVEETVNGPSGKMTGVPDLNLGAKAADEYSMAYSETLILQTNSRSKDAVQFTFVYHTQGQGDLECNLNCSSDGLGLREIDLVTQENANKAVDQIMNAINKVSMVRACFGSVQNRLEHKLTNITVSSENISSSESYIRDTDMPNEMLKYTKSSILSQAAQTMLAQVNQLPASVLQLLR